MIYLRTAIVGLLVLVAVLLLGQDPARATSFNPIATASLSDSTPGANADISTALNLPAPDASLAPLVGFTPPQFDVARGIDIPVGAVVGQLNATVTLGLINGACATPAAVNFTFLNASVNTADTIDPLPPGTPDRLQNIAQDADSNFIPDGADKTPSWLNNIFREDEADPSSIITPRARLFAATFIPSASTTNILNVVVLEPSQTWDPPGPEPPITFDPALGYPSVTVLGTGDDPSTGQSPSLFTDFCTPLVLTTTVFGETNDNPNTGANEAGLTHRTNPTDGSYNLVNYLVSLWDADDDGIENPLDTCPFATNVEDPRQPFPAGDPDFDGIDSACDPDPAGLCWPGAPGVQSFDCDADNYLNRHDNCPQVPNGLDEDNQADADSDGIGDACDDPQSPDGHRHVLCQAATVSVGAGGGTPTPQVTAECPEGAPTLLVTIDIKPGSDPNSVNPKNRGVIPVTILSTPDFDAPTEVDRGLLTFGTTGDEESLAFCTKSVEDINGDGLLDLVCHFHTQDSGFQCGDTEGVLRVETLDGVSIEGTDSVRIVPCR